MMINIYDMKRGLPMRKPRNQKMMKNTRILLPLFLMVFVLAFLVSENMQRSKAATPIIAENQITLKLDQLKKYDGSDPSLPIYLDYEGNIYDVTAGKKYYQPGGSYHWLTGKDATTDLNLVGGDIIKRKYPVVGKIIQ